MNQVYWDRLDILTFAGYALWNYLSFPFLLDGPDVALIGAEGSSRTGILRLDVRFAAGAPTHSILQSFHIDPQRQLVQHDYVAEPIGRWATGANLCLASEVVDGLRFYTRRKVFPRLVRGGGSSRFPRSSGSKSTTCESCSTGNRRRERRWAGADVRRCACQARLANARAFRRLAQPTPIP